MPPYEFGKNRPVLKVESTPVRSRLEIPKGDDPNQNAWLTLTLSYSMSFLDSKNRGNGKIIVKPRGYPDWCALDSNDYVWPIIDWDPRIAEGFRRRYEQATGFWSRRFLIRPPATFDLLDFRCPSVPNFIIRPNILCLLRMEYSNDPSAHHVDVVRLNYDEFWEEGEVLHINEAKPKRKFRWGFGSHSRLLESRDSDNTIGHEVGHALSPLQHIYVMMNDPRCSKADKNQPICYGEGIHRLDPMGAPQRDEKPVWSQFDSEPWRSHLGDMLNRNLISRLCRKEDFCFVLTGVDKHMPERIRESDYATRVPRKLFPNLKPATRKIFHDDD